MEDSLTKTDTKKAFQNQNLIMKVQAKEGL